MFFSCAIEEIYKQKHTLAKSAQIFCFSMSSSQQTSQPLLEDRVEAFLYRAQRSIRRLDILLLEFPRIVSIRQYDEGMADELHQVLADANDLGAEISQSASELSVRDNALFRLFVAMLWRRMEEWRRGERDQPQPFESPEYIFALIDLYHSQTMEYPPMGDRDVAALRGYIDRETASDYRRNMIDIHSIDARQDAGMPISQAYNGDINVARNEERRAREHEELIQNILDGYVVAPQQNPAEPSRPQSSIAAAGSIRDGRTQSDPFTCSVCLQDLDPAESNSDNSHLTTSCDHRFHARCLENWHLSRRSDLTCPNCRNALSAEYFERR